MLGKQLSDSITVSGQITKADVRELAANGVQVIVCNRPDGESSDQTPFSEIESVAQEHGIAIHHIPFSGSDLSKQHVNAFALILASQQQLHMYCRTGNRCQNLYQATLGVIAQPGAASQPQTQAAMPHYDVVIIGAGSAGVGVAASLLKRSSQLRIAMIDPATEHYYQPGWTLVGAGEMAAESTRRQTKEMIPKGVTWRKQSAVNISANGKMVELDDGSRVGYQQLIVCPGLVLDWGGIEGLTETLGRNGVTSNYRYDLAPYTWELVSSLRQGTALFTQPAMPIKCAGAPQKAMYLSADHWRRNGVLPQVEVQFNTVTPSLFGVADFVPALRAFCEQYGAQVNTQSRLIKVDGEKKIAWFEDVSDEGKSLREQAFDMIHVCPPQKAPTFVAASGLADAGGWLSVDEGTLQSTVDENIWGVGDVISAANAKTMAAARKQVVVVADQIMAKRSATTSTNIYDGYGACPLTVAQGRVVLAEFGYGGRLLPTFPAWLNRATSATRFGWLLKKRIMPWVYWNLMAKGREWLTRTNPEK